MTRHSRWLINDRWYVYARTEDEAIERLKFAGATVGFSFLLQVPLRVVWAGRWSKKLGLVVDH